MAEQHVVPALRILRYETSGRFYTKGLGFEVEWKHRFEPDFPVFVSINRDGMRIFLTEHTGDCQVGGLVHFYIPNVDALTTSSATGDPGHGAAERHLPEPADDDRHRPRRQPAPVPDPPPRQRGLSRAAASSTLLLKTDPDEQVVQARRPRAGTSGSVVCSNACRSSLRSRSYSRSWNARSARSSSPFSRTGCLPGDEVIDATAVPIR